MLGKEFSDAAAEQFAAQFKPHGDGYLYFLKKDAPVMVGAAERDRFVSQFKSAIKGRFWLLIATMIALLAWRAIFDWGTASFAFGTEAGLAVAGVFVLILFQYYWAWTIPARALRGRRAEAIRKE